MTYSQSDLTTAINSAIHGKLGNLIDSTGQAIANRAIREVNGEIDIRTTKRLSQVSPGIYDDEYTYLCPVDLKGISLIDVSRQVNRKEEFTLTTAEEFDRRKTYDKGLVAFADHDGTRILNIATDLSTSYLLIDSLQTATDDGTWAATTQIGNLSTDYSNFIYGSSSLRFDFAGGGTTGSLTNSTLTSVDLSKYTNNELFLYVYIPDTTNLTNFILNWGSSASAYWSKTVTTTHEGLAFYTGWNLLRFTWPASSSSGFPNAAAITYAQLTITLSGSHTSTGWRVNLLVARIGDIHNVIYYSKYGWQTSAGTYIENSTTSTDLVNADTEEFDLYVKKGSYLAGRELRFKKDELDEMKKDYADSRDNYKMRYPSERKILTTTTHRFASIDGDDEALQSDFSTSNQN